MVYAEYKDFSKIKESDKVLKDKAFKIASNPKYNGYERRLASVVYKTFNKLSTGSGIKSMSNQRPLDLATQQLADKLRKPIFRKLKKEKVLFFI